MIAGANRTVHFENYIIRGDATGRRFATAWAERARAGVRVRILYDAFGSRGPRRAYWPERGVQPRPPQAARRGRRTRHDRRPLHRRRVGRERGGGAAVLA